MRRATFGHLVVIGCGFGLAACADGTIDGSGASDSGIADAASGDAGQTMRLPSAGSSGAAGTRGTRDSGGVGASGSGGVDASGSGGHAAAGSGGAMMQPQPTPDAGMEDAGAEPGSDEPPGPRYIGRTDRSEPGVVRMGWSGSGMLFRFEGTQASVTLDDRAQFYTLLVDGQMMPALATTQGERDYQVASGLPHATHTVELYRRTEASFGSTRFLGIDVGDDGTLLSPPPAKKRRIEVIGDSITCGYGDEGQDSSCPFEAATENHYVTYAAISARDLDAELVTIAWSGKGIIYNYGDDTNEPMPAIYDRVWPDAQSHWDFSTPPPDVVVINLGTNDFSTDNDPSQMLFGDAYRAFLQHLRMVYPEAWIVCLAPTSLGGDDLTTAENYITQVVDDLTGSGDDHLLMRTLEFTQTGSGCDYHPSKETHASMAEALTTELRSILKW